MPTDKMTFEEFIELVARYNGIHPYDVLLTEKEIAAKVLEYISKVILE